MKTAKQHNAQHVGHSEVITCKELMTFCIVGENDPARAILSTLFKACGWKEKRIKPKRSRRPNAPKKKS